MVIIVLFKKIFLCHSVLIIHIIQSYPIIRPHLHYNYSPPYLQFCCCRHHCRNVRIPSPVSPQGHAGSRWLRNHPCLLLLFSTLKCCRASTSSVGCWIEDGRWLDSGSWCDLVCRIGVACRPSPRLRGFRCLVCRKLDFFRLGFWQLCVAWCRWLGRHHGSRARERSWDSTLQWDTHEVMCVILLSGILHFQFSNGYRLLPLASPCSASEHQLDSIIYQHSWTDPYSRFLPAFQPKTNSSGNP